MARVTEEQLILPALYLMDISPSKSITTTAMKEALVDIFKPTGDDNAIIAEETIRFLLKRLEI